MERYLRLIEIKSKRVYEKSHDKKEILRRQRISRSLRELNQYKIQVKLLGLTKKQQENKIKKFRIFKKIEKKERLSHKKSFKYVKLKELKKYKSKSKIEIYDKQKSKYWKLYKNYHNKKLYCSEVKFSEKFLIIETRGLILEINIKQIANNILSKRMFKKYALNLNCEYRYKRKLHKITSDMIGLSDYDYFINNIEVYFEMALRNINYKRKGTYKTWLVQLNFYGIK